MSMKALIKTKWDRYIQIETETEAETETEIISTYLRWNIIQLKNPRSLCAHVLVQPRLTVGSEENRRPPRAGPWAPSPEPKRRGA